VHPESAKGPARAGGAASPIAQWSVAVATTAVAWAMYRSTLLQGFDLGDTASFQAVVESPILLPRHAYPLYFAVGKLAVWLVGSTAEGPARALNLASAASAALACGVLSLVSARLSGSAIAGLFGGLLFAGSLTFWSQAVIAEVYALHAALIALSTALLLAWAGRPSDRRLALFFAAYAVGFGNHLSMVLFLPGFTLFLVLEAGWRRLLRWHVAAIAALLAGAGALQYAWNAYGLVTATDPPPGTADMLATLWFDVTKSDWRDSLVGMVPAAQAAERLAMYWHDLRLQVGTPGVALAAAGTVSVARTWPAAAAMLLAHYLCAASFALTYNVGDTHVFLLSSHLVVAVLAGCGVAVVSRLAASVLRPSRRPAFAVVLACAALAYPAWRVRDTWPAADRSHDRRPIERLRAVTAGLDPSTAVLAAQMNWEIQNGLDYFARYVDPGLVWFRLADALPIFPFLERDNRVTGRTMIVTAGAVDQLRAAFGDAFVFELDVRVDARMLGERVGAAAGQVYVLCRLPPTRDFTLDESDLNRVAVRMAGRPMPTGLYSVVAGVAGRAPIVFEGSDRPFRLAAAIDDLGIEVRFSSWVRFDTIRRAGFGHVIANGRQALIVERGASFVALDRRGRPAQVAYAGGTYAPEPRFIARRR
jgi:hypothetical protein